ncbi:MAG: hypothetical protein WC967_13190 [Balneolaceae bacterium]
MMEANTKIETMEETFFRVSKHVESTVVKVVREINKLSDLVYPSVVVEDNNENEFSLIKICRDCLAELEKCNRYFDTSEDVVVAADDVEEILNSKEIEANKTMYIVNFIEYLDVINSLVSEIHEKVNVICTTLNLQTHYGDVDNNPKERSEVKRIWSTEVIERLSMLHTQTVSIMKGVISIEEDITRFQMNVSKLIENSVSKHPVLSNLLEKAQNNLGAPKTNGIHFPT